MITESPKVSIDERIEPFITMGKNMLDDAIRSIPSVDERFNRVAYKQYTKGVNKYGQPLNYNDKYKWDEMAAQEAVDLCKYILAMGNSVRQRSYNMCYKLDLLDKCIESLHDDGVDTKMLSVLSRELRDDAENLPGHMA